MKALFIGGTGTISTQISKKLIEEGHELYLVNRGNRNDCLPEGGKYLICDVNDEAKLAGMIKDEEFDVVADFIAFEPEQLERDYRLFQGKTKQFVFISSASAYQKPLANYRITEGTPLVNPYWEYSRNKIACEDYLMRQYREDGFPVTIVRPSHTYNERAIPMAVHGAKGSWQVAKRMMEGKKVIVHGDGTTLWTMTNSKDFANAFVGLMGNVRALGETVQITSDESLTWDQIYQSVANALGVECKLVHASSEFLSACDDKGYDFNGSLIGDKTHTVVFDNTKLKSLVPEFVATIRFDQGVREVVEYVLAHPEFQEEDPEFDEWCDKVIAALDEAVEKVRG